MLRLVDVDKTYKVADGKVEALKKVNLSFRKNEFVSVLGPSGSGKTTLLNIVGGLDKYTAGDLIIAGKSTKSFKDRDWDFYRNQRIGFIFQSYNLIPHQNVLSNVELALTISGISKTERVARAKEALDKVGLSDQYYKKPNQLSGGQCQRVAIARALVNNPEILLADEPTGALDTKTSEQIMQLIKEISKDRLVIMVTHNPDLADRYSTRIINLLDGEIVHDSKPFKEEDEKKEVASLSEETIEKKSKAKMGLWTANKLSFKNLISKKGRTTLVAIASSIGIIGVSTVLSVSFGVTNYVNGMQDDMLSSYPLEIAEKSIDLSSLISGLAADQKADAVKFNPTTQVGMESMIDYLMDRYSDMTNIKTNDINERLISYINDIPKENIAAAQYKYGVDVTNNIFVKWKNSSVEKEEEHYVSANGLTQRYISELKTVEGFSTYASYVDLFTNFMKEMPGDQEYILNQYDMLGNSKFATKSNEMMLVVTKESTLTDLLLGQLGYYNHDEFINIGRKAVEIYKRGEKDEDKGLKQKYNDGLITRAQYDEGLRLLAEEYPYRQIFNYDELIGRDFYYFPHGTIWDYGNVSDETSMTGTVILKNDDYLFYLPFSSLMGMDALLGLKAKITGGTEPETVAFVRQASPSRDPETFFDGTWAEFSTKTYAPTGGAMVISTGTKTVTYVPKGETPQIFLNANITAEETGKTVGFNYPAQAKDEWINDLSASKGMKVTISGILRAKEDTNFGSLQRGVYYTNALTDKYMADAINENSKIYNSTNPLTGYGIKYLYDNNQAGTTLFNAYCTYQYVDYTDTANPVIKTGGYASALNGDLTDSLGSLFSSAIGSANNEATNQIYLRALTGLKATYDEENSKYNIKKLPQQIDIYPKNFDAKDKVTQYLDRWNSDDVLVINGERVTKLERTNITYTDTVAMIISMINSLITIVTTALVAFTSLSLVVSCFMIAVITYISVMERVKEIGVIRSLGGRKKDVNRLFTAENFMTGLTSGVFGIAVTYLLSGLINLIVSLLGLPAIAMLPWWVALIMVGLSIFLNVISGFLPSRKAAKQDPVVALRSE